MKNKLSFVGVIIAISGNILMVNDKIIYGCILFLFSNVMLGYTNRHDKNQIILFSVYQIIALYGIYNTLS
jgi:hypothetical protein